MNDYIDAVYEVMQTGQPAKYFHAMYLNGVVAQQIGKLYPCGCTVYRIIYSDGIVEPHEFISPCNKEIDTCP